MVFVFGVNLPVMEIMFFVILLFIVGLLFMIWQMLKTNTHMRILEDMTSEIKKYEMHEADEVRRFELDVKNLESDEAELFLAKSLPTITKMENFVAAELIKSKKPAKILDALVLKGIKKDLGTKVVNSMSFYLDYYGKLPKKQHESHISKVQAMKVTPPKGVTLPTLPKFPNVK